MFGISLLLFLLLLSAVRILLLYCNTLFLCSSCLKGGVLSLVLFVNSDCGRECGDVTTRG